MLKIINFHPQICQFYNLVLNSQNLTITPPKSNQQQIKLQRLNNILTRSSCQEDSIGGLRSTIQRSDLPDLGNDQNTPTGYEANRANDLRWAWDQWRWKALGQRSPHSPEVSIKSGGAWTRGAKLEAARGRA